MLNAIRTLNRTVIAVTVLGLALVPRALAGDSSQPPHRLSPIIADSTTNVGLRNVTVAGHWGFCSIAAGLLVLDLTDLSAPQFVTRLEIGNPRPPQATGHFRVEIQGRFAYLPHWLEGLYVIDISDPAQPLVVGHLASPDRVRSIEVHGRYGYLAGADQALKTIDLSDPTQPMVVDSILDHLLVYDFCVVGTHLYAAAHFLYTFDITDPAHPVLLHTFTETAWAYSVAVQGTQLFVADIHVVQSGGLQGLGVFDISTPDVPVLLGSNPQHAVDEDAVPVGNHCFMTNENSGLHAADVSNPEQPVYVNCYETGVPPQCAGSFEGSYTNSSSVAVVDGFAYVSCDQGLLIYALDSRGDINADAKKNAADIILLVNYVFKSGLPPNPVEQGDTECLGGITSADIIYLVNFVFKGSTPPVCP